MADQAETPKILEEISKKNNPKTGAKGKTKAHGSKSNNGGLLILVLVLPVIAALAFLAYQQRLSTAEFASIRLENQRLQELLNSQSTQFQLIQQQLLQAIEQAEAPADDSALMSLQAEVQNRLERLDSELDDVRSLQLSTPVSPDFEWKIFEADYLLGIANQKIQLEADIPAAIVMMETADEALLSSGSNRVFAVRQALANELTRLRGFEPFDRQGVYVRIGGLIEQVGNIDLISSMRENFESAGLDQQNQTAIESVATSSWFSSSLDFLSSVFVWREWEESPSSMLAPEQGVYIKQNLKLMLEQSQLALLMKDQTVFSQSLRKTRDWLTRYAVVDSSVGQQIFNSLNELANINIDPVLPAIDESLTLMRQLTASER